MKVATLLFTYNRSKHAKKVIDALSMNSMLPEKLFVFQDGLKSEYDSAEWQKVNELIKSIDWCDTEIVVSECNKGLAESIISGVAYAFLEYDAVIVLEDDCVPAPAFMNFMRQCFVKYQDNKNIHSVSGYAYPVPLKKGKYDVYACGRISSWGWGTWRDRWVYYEKDYELIKRMKQRETASRNLAMWGGGLENMLVGNIRGETDSWAVFWALNAIAEGGICLNPYESLIRNIGLDGSGRHCGSTDVWNVNTMDREKENFNLPDIIEIEVETIEAFTSLFGSYTALNLDGADKERVLVYGLGNFYLRNEQKICEKYYVEAFIDRKKYGWFAGKRIIKRPEIDQYIYDKILVMIWDDKDCLDVKKQLTNSQIDIIKIMDGHDFYE